MNLYVTDSEIKSYLGISGSAQDTVIAMLNKTATDRLNKMLSVNDLALHKTTGEIHDACGVRELRLKDMHVQAISRILSDREDGEEYTQTEAYDIDNYVLHLENYLTAGPRAAEVDYVAGWNASGMAKLTVTISGLAAAATITLGNLTGATNGGTLTRGTQWTAQATDALEAAAIAAAMNATAYVRAFAVGNVVWVIENGGATAGATPQLTGRTIATSDSTRLALSAATLAGVDFPESLRHAVMLLVGGMLAQRKAHRVKSYTIGSKTVTFASDADAEEFKAEIAAYKRVRIIGV